MEIAYHCWPETLSQPPNVAVSGWMLFALAGLNLPATEADAFDSIGFDYTAQKGMAG